MNLSPHFTLEEMLHSDTAEKKKIENRINAAEVDNLVRLCQKVLEPLRAHFGVPIKINSAFRCKALNAAVGGAVNSYHTKGRRSLSDGIQDARFKMQDSRFKHLKPET